METAENNSVLLGLDIGPNSIGWSLLQPDNGTSPDVNLISGVHIFEGGLDDLETDGKGKSRNLDRRNARAVRRLLWRRAHRLQKLAVSLQGAGLLPDNSDLENPQQRNALFDKLDKEFKSPYQLRARSLDSKLEPYELGRALYHLGQRRGFLSNRKTPVKDEKELGVVKGGINDLSKKISEAGARTLGEYFANKVIPEGGRVRGHYTSRQMYEDEFELIWNKQKEYYPDLLNDEFKEKIHHHIFYQRPLKSQKHLIGECSLERGRRRAPWALLIAQRFRYLQRLNDLSYFDRDEMRERKIEGDQRKILIELFETKEKVSFGAIRKALKLRGIKFNLELGGEKNLPGNKTTARIIKAIGKTKWFSLSEREKEALVVDLRCIRKEETLKRRGIKAWGLDEEAAEKFGTIQLEDGYCNYSRQALQKLLPLLEKGVPLQTAIKELYPEQFENTGKPMDSLPPILESGLPELRNPVVMRSLTEIRKLVNAIIKRYGKPDIIRIELARELKQSPKQRQETTKRMRRNEKERNDIREQIRNETGIENPTYTDILKVRLAKECNWECPYTGTHISMQQLIGPHPQFDIEHIIPHYRSLDNSFTNLTLCEARENREVKRNRTPYEAYHDTAKWEDIIRRVERFDGPMRNAKLRRFLLQGEELEKFLDGFTNRQLNDTAWASKWAKKYLGLLYGDIKSKGIDSAGKLRVQAVSGRLTSELRRIWGLNNILGDGNTKSRDDHRHHAIDAIVIALSNPAVVKQLAEASKRAVNIGDKLLKDFPQPWEGFHNDVKRVIDGIIASHRVSKRVRGALHQGSNYGKPRKDKNGNQYVHIRKPIDGISKKEVENIVHPTTRKLVMDKLAELGESDPKKAFKEKDNHPRLMTKSGEFPIHRVTVRMNLSATFPVGKNYRTRYVISDRNHHIEIVEKPDGKWDGYVVSMFEAYQRKKNGEPIVKREFENDEKFLFSLANGEIIELDGPDNKSRALYVIRTIPQSKQLYFVPINDARKSGDIGRTGLTAIPNALKSRNCKKMLVTKLGEVRFAND